MWDWVNFWNGQPCSEPWVASTTPPIRPLVNGVIEQDYDALVALYNATDGINWHSNGSWLDPTVPVAKWLV